MPGSTVPSKLRGACGEGNLGFGHAELHGVHEVDVVGHSGVGVTRAQLDCQASYGPVRELLHRLELLVESLLHRPVAVLPVQADHLGVHLPGHGLSAPLVHVDNRVADPPGMRASVEQHCLSVFGPDDRGPVVMRGHEQVDSLEAFEKVEALALQHGAVALAGARMHHDYGHVGILLLQNLIHAVLHVGNQREEIHSLPELLSEPGLHVRVREAEHGHAEAGPVEHRIHGEVRFAVVGAHGVASQPGDVPLREFGREFGVHLVIDRMSGLYIVVSDNYRIIAHIVHEPREDMTSVRGDVVVVIRRIVALQAVARVEQQHVFTPHRIPEAVDIAVDMHQTVGHIVVHIRAVEP